jgi:hypothetical protein
MRARLPGGSRLVSMAAASGFSRCFVTARCRYRAPYSAQARVRHFPCRDRGSLNRGAYTDIGRVMRAQRALVRIVRRREPVLAFKGRDARTPRWRGRAEGRAALDRAGEGTTCPFSGQPTSQVGIPVSSANTSCQIRSVSPRSMSSSGLKESRASFSARSQGPSARARSDPPSLARTDPDSESGPQTDLQSGS